ncbi:hypothetical protein [Aliidiomarina soli]|uniref:Uncharacterized protein n=1 Tax=Aliidiomarina soli TaxID=1928574 RepID=A0A432WBU5_9GAMM|nr:hypothetical protein [Aliidiomarina soli]RUO29547.1 hypothetical protein CWE14_13875 [Aliidiomarina soli]
MEFKTNTELFKAIESLQEDLASSGQADASALMLKGISGLNGLTDGWAYLLEHLHSAKQEYGASFSPQQSLALSKIKSTVHKIVYRA